MVKEMRISLALVMIYSAAHSQNYNEDKVLPYTLPEALQSQDGTTVDDTATWEAQRRSEILRLFEDHVYGQMPVDHDSIFFKLINHDSQAMNGAAHLKEVAITIWRNARNATIGLTIFVPAKSEKPVPAFLLINNRGRENTDPTRVEKSEFWPAEMVVEKGYAIAAFHVSDAAPDQRDTYQQGILKLYPEQIGAGNGMKAIGAWAWAASRVMDYFESDKDINADKVALVGHSRGGKAALWAGAQDERFALVFSNNSGNTGAALSRRNFGETVKAINDAFPHWFADNYKKYNDNENALPVDQHMLISLIAPRPVYVTSASRDLWADPKGSYLSLLQAEEVYRLYGRRSALSPESPAINKPIIESFLGYHIREGEHNLTAYDWKNFVLYADFHFKN